MITELLLPSWVSAACAGGRDDAVGVANVLWRADLVTATARACRNDCMGVRLPHASDQLNDEYAIAFGRLPGDCEDSSELLDERTAYRAA